MALPTDLSWLANLPGETTNNPNASGNTGQTLAGRTSASVTDPEFQQQLAQIKQYDPNATVVPSGDDGKFFDISYDQSKMPAVPKETDSQQWARPADFASQFQSQMDSGGGSPAIYHSVIDPSKDITSPYGQLTPGSNVTTSMVPTKPGLLDTLGPLAVGIAAGGLPGLFTGLDAAGAGLGGELGASAAMDVGTSGLGTALTKGAMQIPGALGNSNPSGVEGSAIGIGGSLLGMPPWLQTLARSSPALYQMLTAPKP